MLEDMKLIVIIVPDRVADGLVEALVRDNVPATKISSSGGFLRRANATILVAVEAGEVEEVIGIVRDRCPARVESLLPAWFTTLAAATGTTGTAQEPMEVRVGGAVIFVLSIERFEKT